MKILVVGAGGVGGYYGAMLARAGSEVFLIARGLHLAAMRESGLAVESVNGDFNVKVRAGERAGDFGVADVVLVCVKSYDTEETLRLYRENVGPETMIVSLQNGIDNEKIIADEYGWDRVLGGIAFIGTRIAAPGVIKHTAYGHVALGEFNEPGSGKAARLCRVFEDAGVKCRVSDDIWRDLLGKMVWNVGFNAMCAILDCAAAEAAGFEETRATVKEAMLEWIHVTRAMGSPLDFDLADKNIEGALKGGEVIPSMLHDRRVGRLMEIDTFNGKVVELGEKTGVETPVNRAITGMIRFFNSRRPGAA